MPFLGYAVGWPQTIMAVAEAVMLWMFHVWRRKPSDAPRSQDEKNPDTYTFLKMRLLRRLLAGHLPEPLAAAAQKLRRRLKWNESMRRALDEHAAAGHRIVVASGGLDLYLPELLKDLPAHDLICTQVEVRDGIVTGAMPSGNCVRARKAELLADYIARHGPFAESWGYGNFPQDLPMLALVKYRIIV